MRTRTWRWNRRASRWQGGCLGQTAASSEVGSVAYLYVPPTPVWYGVVLAPPARGTPQPIRHYNTAR